MKNSLKILIFIISFFIGIHTIFAAPKLSCLYPAYDFAIGKFIDKDAVYLSQDETGKLTIYRRPIDDNGSTLEGWAEDRDATPVYDDTLGNYVTKVGNEVKYFNRCPKYVSFDNTAIPTCLVTTFVSGPLSVLICGSGAAEQFNNRYNIYFTNKKGAFKIDNPLVGSFNATYEEVKTGKIELPDFEQHWDENYSCDILLGDPAIKGTPAYYLSKAFSIIRYVAIVMLIVLTIIDFVGAVASQDESIMKKTFNKLMVRAVICVVILVLPTIINFTMKTVYNKRKNDTLCGLVVD